MAFICGFGQAAEVYALPLPWREQRAAVAPNGLTFAREGLSLLRGCGSNTASIGTPLTLGNPSGVAFSFIRACLSLRI